jgi:hypothetical protein
MKFSKKVKTELSKIRETGKDYKKALAYGSSYGSTDTGGGAESLIADSILSGGEDIGGIFLRGVFLSCGSVTDPNKDYHLELVPPSKEKCMELLEFMSDRGLKMKLSERKSQSFLYCKGNEQIADFLTYIGAARYSMELMNVMILKEIRNNVNRAVNCESANIDKITRAALKQKSDIEYIFKQKGEDFLPENLKSVAVIRQKNIEMSLEEIGRKLEPAISKSGVNHRLRKIGQIADDLRKMLDVSNQIV